MSNVLAWAGFFFAALGVFCAVSILVTILFVILFGKPAAKAERAPRPVEDFWLSIDSPTRPENDPMFWSIHRVHMDNGLTFAEAHAATLEEWPPRDPPAVRAPRRTAGEVLRADGPYDFGTWPIVKPGREGFDA